MSRSNGQAFKDPLMPKFKFLRLMMGLSLAEAARALNIKKSLLKVEEVRNGSNFLNYEQMRTKYNYFVTQEEPGDHRNHLYGIPTAREFMTLFRLRQSLGLTLEQMALHYGYTADEWWAFEIHKTLIPSLLRSRLEKDTIARLIRSEQRTGRI